MMSLLPFIGISVLLLIEGNLTAYLVLPDASVVLRMLLGLPIAAVVNLVIVLIFTFTGVPLTAITIIVAHLIVVQVLGFLSMKRAPLHYPTAAAIMTPKLAAQFLLSTGGLLIAIATIYSASHALLLPTFQYDSTTNWTMRSKESFYDRHIAFETDEVSRGMGKPMYPVLFHALQITANGLQSEWNDRAANAILYLLSIGTFGAALLMLRRLCGWVRALLATTLMLGIPLLSVHLAQGYGDLNLIQYMLLALCALLLFIDAHEDSARRSEACRWLVLSALFVVASMHTKSEGFIAAFIPWMLTLALILRKKREWWKVAGITSVATFLTWVPWMVLLVLKGLPITSHNNDAAIAFHMDGLKELIPAIFSRGSFGPLWYTLPTAIVLILLSYWRRDKAIDRKYVPVLLWGGIVLIEVLFTYVFTRNVEFLINGQSFYRQMLLPAVLWIATCAVIVRTPEEVQSNHGTDGHHGIEVAGNL